MLIRFNLASKADALIHGGGVMGVRSVVRFCLFAFSSCVYASNPMNSQLVFDGTPFVNSDQVGRFSSCGFIIATESKATSAGEGVSMAIRIAAEKNKTLQVVATLASMEKDGTEWVPSPKIIQWIRIGDAEPIVLDPYNLGTQKEKGLSYFSTVTSENMKVFKEVEKHSPAVWVKFYSDKEYSTYSGVLKINEVALAQVRQCLKVIQ